MFTCSTCVRRALRSLLNDLPQSEPVLFTQPILPQPLPIQSTRSFSSTPSSHVTLRSLSQGHHRRVYAEARQGLAKERRDLLDGGRHLASGPSNTRRNKARELPVDRRNRHAIENNSKHLLTLGSEDKDLKIAAAKEVQWINDPLRLANRVLTYLRDENQDGIGFEKALELVRAAEKHSIKQGQPQGALNNVVAWNHLVDFAMSKSDPRSAYKVYNEMKKRGHRPDAHTYTILLRGFADNLDKPNVVHDAMTVYDSISAFNSEVTPNTVHLNAALNVAARAVDMDRLWHLIGKAKHRGQGSPDVTTYTIVLNAIQQDIIKRAAQLLVGQKDADVSGVFASAITDGRKVWADVIVKWREAEINVDEHLVCAMGRLLLMSKKMKDVMDVFMLVQQTMNVRMPKAPIERHDDEKKNPHEQLSVEDEEALKVFDEESPRQQTRVAPVEGPAKSLYATPAGNTLSMLIEAATITKQMHLGKAYWDLLIDPEGPYAIKPDVQNISAYLRLLRISRSSRVALEVLKQDWPENVKDKLYTRGTFVIAMSTCVRDKNNHNIFEVASQILEVMQEKADQDQEATLKQEEEAIKQMATSQGQRLKSRRSREKEDFKGETLELDPKIMTMYLNLAMWTTKGVNPRMRLQKTRKGDLDFERDPSKNNTMRALARLEPTILTVRRMMEYRLAELEKEEMTPRQRLQSSKNKKGWVDYNKTQERLEDLVGLYRGMISAYDRLLTVNWKLEDEGMGPLDGGQLEDIKLNKAKLATYLSKIDRKVLAKMKSGDSGLWEGYDPDLQSDAKEPKPFSAAIGVAQKRVTLEPDGPDTSYGAVDKDGKLVSEPAEEAEDELVEEDMVLSRTPGNARLRKEVNKRVKVIETQRDNARKWLSRRQTQEKEKVRREDRQSRLHPGEASKQFARRQDFSQGGWGGGYDAMASRTGQRGTSGLVDVQSM